MSGKYVGMAIDGACNSGSATEPLRVVSHDEPKEYTTSAGQTYVHLKAAVCSDGQAWDLTFPVVRATLTGVKS